MSDLMSPTQAAEAAQQHHAEISARRDAHVFDTYGRTPLTFVRGKGTALFDGAGRAYLDFLSGLAVTSLGHAHPAVTAAVAAQAETLVHTSNLFITEPAVELAERLARITGWDDAKVFFAQCGATANEAAIKLARRHGLAQSKEKFRVVTLEGSFHGRTFATLEATGQPAKHEPFAPLMGYVDTVPADDPAAMTAAVGPQTCAVLIELVQGEGGVRPTDPEVVSAARAACDAHGALLIVDEVQTGIGRTGPWFAFQHEDFTMRGLVPDVITVAKALGNGFPIGAMIARGAAADAFGPGDHATTFGGNPVTAAAASAVIDTIEDDNVLALAASRARRLVAGIDALVGDAPFVTGVRGRGLLLGVVLDAPVAKAVEVACRDHFLIVNAVAPDVVRLAPPLNVTREEVDLALAGLRQALVAVAEGTAE